jgi:hypothetical protein
MLVTIGAVVIGRWAHNQSFSAKDVIEGLFAVLVIAFMDQGETEPVAKGFAWLFFVAVMLGKNSPLTALNKVQGGSTGSTGVQVV